MMRKVIRVETDKKVAIRDEDEVNLLSLFQF